MKHTVWFVLLTVLVVAGGTGCQSIRKFLNPEPTPEEIRKKAERKSVRRSPTDVLPFKAKESAAPSLYDNTLNAREREALRGFRAESDREMAEPGMSKESRAARNWVFGY